MLSDPSSNRVIWKASHEPISIDGAQPEAATPQQKKGDHNLQKRLRDKLLTRFVGALQGGAMGDALGRPAESMPPQQVATRFGRLVDYQKWHGWKDGPIGTITDDTQLTMCVAACLSANGFLDPEDLSRRFVVWLPSGRGTGRATVSAVGRLTAGTPWYLAGEESSGNGAAMRAAPVGLVYWNDPGQLHTAAVLSALPTHREPMGVAGAVAMAAATAFLVTKNDGDWTTEEFVATVQQAIAGLEPGPLPERRDSAVKTTLHDRLGELPGLLSMAPEQVFARLYNGAYVLESLPAAFYCFLRSPADVEQMLLVAVNAGYDADTVAAMAGTLGGALGGEAALPRRLLTELEYRDELHALGGQLIGLAVYGDSTAGHSQFTTFGVKSIPNSRLAAADVPGSDADWQEIWRFALTFDGYEYWGTFDAVVSIAQQYRHTYTDRLPGSLTDLRTCLFWEQRLWRNDGRDPLPTDLATRGYVTALLNAIRARVRTGAPH